MQKVNSKGINPNEEIRKQFRELVFSCNDDEDAFDKLVEVMEFLKAENYAQYVYNVKLIYQDVYVYYNYVRKTGETNLEFYSRYNLLLFVNNFDEILESYEMNDELYLGDFIYLLKLNNLAIIKMYLELDKKQIEYLLKTVKITINDLLTLEQSMNFKSLEDYFYYRDADQFVVEEDIVEEVMYFLEYLRLNHPDKYKKYILEILNKIYKWSCYYVEHSIEIDECDLEQRVIELTNIKSIDKILEALSNDKILLSDIILRLFDDMELGYPVINTKDGEQLINESDIDKYMLTKKKPF